MEKHSIETGTKYLILPNINLMQFPSEALQGSFNWRKTSKYIGNLSVWKQRRKVHCFSCLFLRRGWPRCAACQIFLLWPGIEPVPPAWEGRDLITGPSRKPQKFRCVAQSCLTLCNSHGCNMSGFPVHHQLPERAQTHVHQVSDAIQPSHPLSSPSPTAFNLSQHQGLF